MIFIPFFHEIISDIDLFFTQKSYKGSSPQVVLDFFITHLTYASTKEQKQIIFCLHLFREVHRLSNARCGNEPKDF
ncbi:hypothetical protein GsuE55_08480 [Geobacillus subterraneus]|uniref:Uncharacterized protein n=1 Tax=Geobacillus subterraneus TaxID=129338 RepID=A0A679FN37_9BACL|nr:hypothetical protein GsuE55_08480 [Geobacillus subterraneus]